MTRLSRGRLLEPALDRPPCLQGPALIVLLVTTNGTINLWQSFNTLELPPLVHHLQRHVAAVSVCCGAHLDQWQAAVALEGPDILMLKAHWHQSTLETMSLMQPIKTEVIQSNALDARTTFPHQPRVMGFAWSEGFFWHVHHIQHARQSARKACICQVADVRF